MKKLLFISAMLMASSVSYGALLCTEGYTGPVNVLDINLGGGCTVATAGGDLLFSNFQVQAVGGTGSAQVDLFDIFGVGTSSVALAFNPSMFSGGVTDMHFAFQVTGLNGLLINEVSLDGGQANGSINESVCSVAQNFATGACSGTLLASMVWTGPNGPALQTPIEGTNTIYVWKDILIPHVDGHNSGFTQDFGTVPEPGSLALMGSGLLGLGLLARRRNAKK